MNKQVRIFIVIVCIALLFLLLFLILTRPFSVSITRFEQAPLSALAILESREATQVTLSIQGKKPG